VKLLLATRSAHKVREVAQILTDCGRGVARIVTLQEAGVPWSPAEDDLEPYGTFEENAASKARYFAGLTGLPTVADDSGLEVEALRGRPGVKTRRFASPKQYPTLERDEANNRHLLDLLRDCPPAMRRARYVCVASLMVPRPDALTACASAPPVFFRGEAPGRIARRPRGSGGFGYDPLFLDGSVNLTYAELTPAEKHARSHRGQAFRMLVAHLRKTCATPDFSRL